MFHYVITWYTTQDITVTTHRHPPNNMGRYSGMCILAQVMVSSAYNLNTAVPSYIYCI